MASRPRRWSSPSAGRLLATIFRDTTRPRSPLDANILDAPTRADFVEEARESYCLACQAPVAAFESRGGDMAHYVGDPISDAIVPFESDRGISAY